MIGINLLPHAERRGVSPALKLKLGLVIADCALLLVTAGLIVGFVVVDQAKKKEIAATQTKITRLEPDVQEVKNLKVQLSELNTKQEIILKLVKNRIDWARKLHQLAEITQPQPIWLERIQLRTEVKTEKITPPKVAPRPAGARPATPAKPTPKPTPSPTERRTRSFFLTLAGATHVPATERVQRIGQYVDSLKKHAEFFQDFADLNLPRYYEEPWASRGSEESPTVMRFEIELEFALKEVMEIFGRPAGPARG